MNQIIANEKMCQMKPHSKTPIYERNNGICILFLVSKRNSFENGPQAGTKKIAEIPKYPSVFHIHTYASTQFPKENSSVFDFKFAEFVFILFCYTFHISSYVFGFCFENGLDAGWLSHSHFRNGILAKERKIKL